jgi:hypothetical protein
VGSLYLVENARHCKKHAQLHREVWDSKESVVAEVFERWRVENAVQQSARGTTRPFDVAVKPAILSHAAKLCYGKTTPQALKQLAVPYITQARHHFLFVSWGSGVSLQDRGVGRRLEGEG